MSTYEQKIQKLISLEDYLGIAEFRWRESGMCTIIADRLKRSLEMIPVNWEWTKFDAGVELELESRYQIKEVPTYLFFHKGELIDKLSGFSSKYDFLRVLEGIVHPS